MSEYMGRCTVCHEFIEYCNGHASGRFNEEQITEARQWLIDTFPGDSEDIAELSPLSVKRGVERHYPGGWDTFVSECVPAGTAV